jgi:membrane-associated phospholipid phosphatase
MATLVGISRVYLGHHFPSDVGIGAVIGVGTGTMIAGLVRAPKVR